MDLTFLKIKDLDIGIENMFISPRLFFQDGLGLEKEESSQAEIDKLLSQNQEIRPSIKYTKH